MYITYKVCLTDFVLSIRLLFNSGLSVAHSVVVVHCVRLFGTLQTAARSAPLSSRSPGVCSDSCPLSRWRSRTISPSAPPSRSLVVVVCSVLCFQTTLTLLKGVLQALSIIIGSSYFSLSVLSVLLHFIWSSFVIQVNTNVGFDNGIPSLCNVPFYPLWLTQFWSLLSDINVATPDFFCLIFCISFRADLLGSDSPFITFLKILFYFLGPPVFLTKICGHSNSCLLLFLAFWLWYVQLWFSLNFSFLEFTELLESLNLYLLSNLGSFLPLPKQFFSLLIYFSSHYMNVNDVKLSLILSCEPLRLHSFLSIIFFLFLFQFR